MNADERGAGGGGWDVAVRGEPQRGGVHRTGGGTGGGVADELVPGGRAAHSGGGLLQAGGDGAEPAQQPGPQGVGADLQRVLPAGGLEDHGVPKAPVGESVAVGDVRGAGGTDGGPAAGHDGEQQQR